VKKSSKIFSCVCLSVI